MEKTFKKCEFILLQRRKQQLNFVKFNKKGQILYIYVAVVTSVKRCSKSTLNSLQNNSLYALKTVNYISIWKHNRMAYLFVLLSFLTEYQVIKNLYRIYLQSIVKLFRVSTPKIVCFRKLANLILQIIDDSHLSYITRVPWSILH